MDEKLETILGRAATEERADARELQTIQDERKSAQKCLEICGQLSAHIEEIQSKNRRAGASDSPSGSHASPEEITDKGLKECQDTLSSTAEKLEQILKVRLDRMVQQAGTSMSSENRAELESVRDEWETARKCKDLYAKADSHLKANISIIDNYATGDAIQFMVSTDGQILHGKNQGLGWRSRQVGGHMNDASLQQLSRDMFASHFQTSGTDPSSAQHNPSNAADTAPSSQFDGRYGQGFKLAGKSS
jgi:flagellar biosynthesis chaperone FliJ